MSEATETIEVTLEDLIKGAGVELEEKKGPLKTMLSKGLNSVDEQVTEEERLTASLAALIWNIDDGHGRLDKGKIQELIAHIDEVVNEQVNEVLHNDKFKDLESNWLGLHDLVEHTPFRNNVLIDFMDVSKEEIQKDFEDHAIDFTGSALHANTYTNEYGQYGGKPYGSIIGMYRFEHTPADLKWLTMMGKVAAACHAPFISSVSPRFFGCDTVEDLAAIKDLTGEMNKPKYGAFNALRDSEEAAYLGLCLPSYILRLPWHPVDNPCGDFNFRENTWGDDSSKYAWGNAALLFAKNLVSSFVSSGWCQYLRGPKGGGLVSGLPVHAFNIRGEDEIKLPVEMMIPDPRELEFAKCGFIPLIYRKGTADACFFSAQSLKKPKEFVDPKDSENAQLVCNLPYTYSITRIAHYVKSIARDNIGAAADADYIQNTLSKWIANYTTTTTNPDDKTLRRFPFKKSQIIVTEREGHIGWYDCRISVMPHPQMEGLSVDLCLDSRI